MPALQAIRTLGPSAVTAVPMVQRQLKATDPMVRCNALLVLESIGPSSVAALITGLKDPFLMNKALAAKCLGRPLPRLSQCSRTPQKHLTSR